jgi:hypothetical protein
MGILVTGCLLVFPNAFLEGVAIGDPHQRLTNTNEIRTVLIEALVGLAILAGALVTWQQLQGNTALLKLTQDQVKLSEAQQVTERYRESVTQLGDDDLVVRLGGIYSLQRLSTDSRVDQSSIYRVLTAYVRTRSPWPPRRSSAQAQPTRWIKPREIGSLPKRSPDIQLALSVVSSPKRDVKSAAILVDVDLRGALLGSADLSKADLRNAHLDFADARVGQNAEPLKLREADLRGASLVSAQLKQADLSSAKLQASNLKDANLDGAKLCGAKLVSDDPNLADAAIARATFQGASYDEHTTFPDGFAPERHGMRRCPGG